MRLLRSIVTLDTISILNVFKNGLKVGKTHALFVEKQSKNLMNELIYKYIIILIPKVTIINFLIIP